MHSVTDTGTYNLLGNSNINKVLTHHAFAIMQSHSSTSVCSVMFHIEIQKISTYPV